ncbi:MAG: hypothetical protein JXB62_16315 [Pirellulales bacterium]|nr:hypothetical protein [Pirellulales bacterium]
MRINAVDLLNIEKVQQELKVTEQQKQQLEEQAQQRREGMRERFAQMRDLSDEQRQEAFEKLRKEREDAVAKILSAKQVARLEQLRRQVMGFRALGEQDVIEKLGITEDQGAKLSALNTELREKMQALGGRPEGGQEMTREQRMAQMEERRKKVSELQKETMKKAVETVLTSDQKAKWQELVGEEFEISMQDLMRRGPGGPGAAGGRGAGGRGAGERGAGGRGARGPGGGGQ